MEENKKRLPTYGELEDELDKANDRIKELERIIRRKDSYIHRLEHLRGLVNEYLQERQIFSDYEEWKRQEEKGNPYYETSKSNDGSSESE